MFQRLVVPAFVLRCNSPHNDRPWASDYVFTEQVKKILTLLNLPLLHEVMDSTPIKIIKILVIIQYPNVEAKQVTILLRIREVLGVYRSWPKDRLA